VFIIWPDAIFKKENTAIKPYEQPSKLITTGPFKISRHPTYLGMLLLLFGAAIIAGSIAPFIFPIIFTVIIDTCFIRYEEQNLERIFKGAYHQYKRNVRRWI
jgi:protein-S-isoprenylcysteine O-methyltransferase Ste14